MAAVSFVGYIVAGFFQDLYLTWGISAIALMAVLLILRIAVFFIERVERKQDENNALRAAALRAEEEAKRAEESYTLIPEPDPETAASVTEEASSTWTPPANEEPPATWTPPLNTESDLPLPVEEDAPSVEEASEPDAVEELSEETALLDEDPDEESDAEAADNSEVSESKIDLKKS